MNQASQYTNSNKLFIVNNSQIEGRIDPYYFYSLNKILPNSNYPLVKIKHLFRISDGDHSKFPEDQKSNHKEGVRYLRVQDLNDGEIDTDDLLYVSKEYFNSIKRSHIYPGDLLFSVMASLGTMVIVPEDFPASTCNRAIGILRVKDEKISIHFFKALFETSFGTEMIELSKRGAIQQRINLQDLGSLKIPLPPKEIQQKVIDLYTKAYYEKKKKDTEAKILLNSIDGYLLNELGIQSPKQNDKSQCNFFKINLNELNNRMDPIYYYSDLTIFNSGNFESVKISSIVNNIRSGIGAGRQDQASAEDGIIQIRPTNIKEHGALSFNKNVYIPNDDLTEAECLKINDVLFNNTNSQELVGKTAIVKTPNKLSYSNHITRIRVIESKITPDYLCAILNAYQRHKIFYSICTNWNNQSGVGLDLLASLNIPLPPIVKQIEISNFIQKIHSEVEAIQFAGNNIIEDAKKKIEALIN